MLLTILANLLFLAGMAFCLINFYIVLHNLLRGTHASMVPLMGSLFMAGGCLLLIGWPLLCCWLLIFIAGGESIPNQG